MNGKQHRLTIDTSPLPEERYPEAHGKSLYSTLRRFVEQTKGEELRPLDRILGGQLTVDGLEDLSPGLLDKGIVQCLTVQLA